MLASVIVPFYNKIELVHQRMFEFNQYLPQEDIEIILVNDGSTEDGIDGIVGFWQKSVKKHTIRYIKNEKNLGFGGAMNKGASKANGDILVFYSDDVVANGDFIYEIGYLLAGEDRVLVGGELLDFDTGWNKFNGRVVPYLNGWLLACTRTAWSELGGFDLRYSPTDFEDVDLSMTAVQKGFRLEPLRRNHLHHLGGQTAGYGPERQARTVRHQKLFAKKWWKELGYPKEPE
jgi:GT2 family glycosyltransferase